MWKQRFSLEKSYQGFFSNSSRFQTITFISVLSGIILFFLIYCRFTWNDFTDNIGFCTQIFCDFVNFYYPMGEAVFRTSYPYEGFLYSPLIAILLAVFPPLGLNLSLVLWGFLQIVVILLYFLLYSYLLPSKRSFQFIFIGLTLTSYPVWLNFLVGNTGMFITVSLLGALLAFNRGRHAISIILLILAASFKFYPIIFILPFITSTSLRFTSLAVGAGILLLFIVPGLFLGAEGTIHYYNGLLLSFQESDWIVTNPHTQFFPHVILRLFGKINTESTGLLKVLYTFSYCLGVVNLILLYLVSRLRIPYATVYGFIIAFLTIPFMLKTSWPIDFIFLTFVQAFLIRHILERKQSNGDKSDIKNKPIQLSLVLLSVVMTNMIFFNLLDNFTLYGYLGMPFWANLLLLIVIYIEFLPEVRQSLRRNK